jgi:hypothetical protein
MAASVIKVAICIPSGRTWEAEMGLSIAGIVRSTMDLDVTLLWQMGSQITAQRNDLVKMALAEKVDYLYWQDSDIVAPYTTLHELLAHDKSIVGATYCKKVPPHELVGRLKRTSGRLKVAEYMPGGCMLVKAAVYKHLPWPWYFETPEEAEQITTSEDFGFCNKARSRGGYVVYCDIDLSQRLLHLGTQHVQMKLPNGGLD